MSEGRIGRVGGITISPSIITHVGASFGPRVATIRFSDGYLDSAAVAVDLDAAKYQNDTDLRRRAARAAVAFSRQMERRILAGEIRPELSHRTNGWATFELEGTTISDGYERRAAFRKDFKLETAELTAPADMLKHSAARFRRLADTLHVNLDDPAYAHLFGRPAG